MQRVNWRPRTYARMAGPGGGVHDPGGGDQGHGRGGGPGHGRGGGRGGGQGASDQERRQNLIAEGNKQGRELRDLVVKKQAFLQMRFDCDSNRKNLGEGNILTFLLNEGNSENSEVEKKDVNKMLRCAGFNAVDVLGITKNDFRTNQVEVCFADGVELNIPVIEANLKNNGIDANISKFDKIEEYLTIYGLPLSSNMDFIKDQISDSIKAFVKEVIEVTPLCHVDENGDDFFKGKNNGNWRVKVSPRIERQIPNYIVVGQRAKAMGKAVYSKAAGNKLEMCADCFSTGHFKRAPECEGPVKWDAYCRSFKEQWEMMYSEREREFQQEQEGQDGVRQVEEESRILLLEKSLTSRLVEAERKEKELEEKMAEQEEVHQNLEDMTANVEDLERKLESSEQMNGDLKVTLESFEKEKEENRALKERLDHLQKENHDLVKKASEDQSLFERSFERIQSTSNVTVRSKLAKTQETESIEMNATNDVFDSAVAEETSPPFHGFPSPDVEKSSDSSSSQEEPQELVETGLSGTPKRVREGEGPDGRTVRGRTESDKHPEIGSKILMQTISGKCEYVVESKKNKKQGDFLYTLVNSESRRTSFDLKNVPWNYLEEKDVIDPLSSPSSLDVSKP